MSSIFEGSVRSESEGGSRNTASTILIIDVCGSSGHALYDRVIVLAEKLHASVAIYVPVPRDIEDAEKLVEADRLNAGRRASDNLAGFERAEVPAKLEIQVVDSLSDSVLSKVAAVEPTLIVVASAALNKAYPMQATAIIFELLENTASHLWIAQRPIDHDRHVALAAINLDEGSAPERIRNRILSTACVIADRLGKDAHVVHTFTVPAAKKVLADVLARGSNESPVANLEAERVHKVHDLAQKYDFRKECVHVLNGSLVEEIGSLVEPMKVDILLIGESTKQPVERYFGRGQFDSVLQAIPCDLLVVRP